MTLKLRNTKKGDLTINFSNLLSVPEFKQLYIKELKTAGEGLDVSLIRMFAMGKELKDDLFVYSYDITNESTV